MKRNGTVKIDTMRLLTAVWRKKILIAVVSVALAVVTVIGAALFTEPEYQADILIYVNNNSISLGGTTLSFSSGEITAARQLLDSYMVALQSRQCLDAVIEKADLPYTRGQLKEMISAESVNNTEWFTVAVKSSIPEEARIIADTIAEVLPDLLSNTIKGSSVEVVDFAVKPENKVSPGYLFYAELGFLEGLFLMIVIIVLKEALNDKVQNEDTLHEISDDVPVLAAIPHKGHGSYSKYDYGYGSKKKRKYSAQKGKSFDDATAVCEDLDFAAAEAYKLLQTSVQYSFEDDGCKVIGITSSERNEGKSTLAVNLAYMLSCDKKKVLLLEGDMRLPSIAKKLGLDSTPGLSDYLTGKIKNNDGIQHSEKAPALSVICAGVVPPNPFGLLGSASMERLFTALKEVYDYVIVDLPPVNIVSDPLAIAKYLDGFIVTVRSEYTARKGVQDVLEKLQVVNANVIGYVINGDENSSGKKYGKYNKYGKYGKYGYQDKDYEKSYERASAKKKAVRSVPLDSYSDKSKKS